MLLSQFLHSFGVVPWDCVDRIVSSFSLWKGTLDGAMCEGSAHETSLCDVHSKLYRYSFGSIKDDILLDVLNLHLHFL